MKIKLSELKQIIKEEYDKLNEDLVNDTFVFTRDVSTNDFKQEKNIIKKIANAYSDKFMLGSLWYAGEKFQIVSDEFDGDDKYYSVKWIKSNSIKPGKIGYFLKKSIDKLLKIKALKKA